MTGVPPRPEGARDHINNARQILQIYRERIEQGWLGTPGKVVIVARDLRAMDTRLVHALEQIEKGNL
jgi:hypothetical protein